MRGLLVIEPLYHRILSGHKTQTRRSGGLEVINQNPDAWILLEKPEDDDHWLFGPRTGSEMFFFEQAKPRYHIGETLYLKEPYKTVDAPVFIEYGFDKPNPTYESGHISDFRGKGYENKLFMPAGFAREFIRITGIKCERLLDISEEDCIAEGIETAGNWINGQYYPFGYIDYLMREEAGSGYDFCDNTPQQSFISLYKLANKMGKYGSHYPEQPPKDREVPNIWVWVYSFKYVRRG